MINVYYNDSMNINIPTVPARKKLNKLKELWSLNQNINLIHSSKKITKEDLYICHHQKYIDDLFNKKRVNGFRNTNQEILNMELDAVQSMLDSTIDSLTNQVSVSLSAGFHHAHYDTMGAYCTFNGLIYSAMKLKELGLANKVGILDLDFHQGDGTSDIIRRLDLNYIKQWDSFDYWSSNNFLFFSELKRGLFSLKDCDVIIYLAGMDMYKNDPKGGILSQNELIKRDKMVIEFCSSQNIPLAITLAGGYSELNLLTKLHNNTMDLLLKIKKYE